jgi:hypothetical protein
MAQTGAEMDGSSRKEERKEESSEGRKESKCSGKKRGRKRTVDGQRKMTNRI